MMKPETGRKPRRQISREDPVFFLFFCFFFVFCFLFFQTRYLKYLLLALLDVFVSDDLRSFGMQTGYCLSSPFNHTAINVGI